jgi:BlaI family transcriptional regulator, penicillinase repressor
MGKSQRERESGPRTPVPTDAELQILRVLWKRGPSSVREVHESIWDLKHVAYTTVLKQMQVMQRKGLLIRTERHGVHVYEPGAPRQQTQRRLAQDLLRQVFEGSARGLLQSALAGRRIDPAEVAEIRRLLNQLEKKT